MFQLVFFYPGVLLLHWQWVWNDFLLKNEAAANDMPSSWYCIVGQHWTILFFIHNSINFDKIPNTTDWNGVLNHDRASTVFHKMAVGHHCCTSLLTSSIHPDNDWIKTEISNYLFISPSDLLPLIFCPVLCNFSYLSILSLFPFLKFPDRYTFTENISDELSVSSRGINFFSPPLFQLSQIV